MEYESYSFKHIALELQHCVFVSDCSAAIAQAGLSVCPSPRNRCVGSIASPWQTRASPVGRCRPSAMQCRLCHRSYYSRSKAADAPPSPAGGPMQHKLTPDPIRSLYSLAAPSSVLSRGGNFYSDASVLCHLPFVVSSETSNDFYSVSKQCRTIAIGSSSVLYAARPH